MRLPRPFFLSSSTLLSVVWMLICAVDAGAADGSGQVATGYFVDCSAGTNGTGTITNPWNSVTSVRNAQLATGTDVWFKAGTVCVKQSLIIDWSGTASDYATVGTSYVLGGVAYQLTPDNPERVAECVHVVRWKSGNSVGNLSRILFCCSRRRRNVSIWHRHGGRSR